MDGDRKSGNKTARTGLVRKHTELEVYRRAFEAAMRIFELSKTFPPAERYSLTDQLRRASRSVCGNMAEGWRRRRYAKSLAHKLNEAEGEAAEVQVWLQFAVRCEYVDRAVGAALYQEYDEIISMLVGMIRHAEDWTL